MFKYIKKDNHIYEVEIKDNFVFWKEEKDGITFELRISIDGAKENYRCADTIEELCDIFYWDWEDGFCKLNFMSYLIAKNTWNEYVNDCLEDNEKPDRNMYGCIKTSKGIINVAKMNSKGELELL